MNIKTNQSIIEYGNPGEKSKIFKSIKKLIFLIQKIFGVLPELKILKFKGDILFFISVTLDGTKFMMNIFAGIRTESLNMDFIQKGKVFHNMKLVQIKDNYMDNYQTIVKRKERVLSKPQDKSMMSFLMILLEIE